jgi:arylsulfatase A-like enzyme
MIAARRVGYVQIDQEDRAMKVTELGHHIGLARGGLLTASAPRESRITPTPISPYDLLSTASWFGLLTGLLEISQLWIRSWFQGAKLLGGLQINGNFTWMIPVANLTIFAAFGLVLAVLGKLSPRWGTRIAFYFLSFLSAVALLLAISGLPLLVYVVLGGCLSLVIAPWMAAHSGAMCHLVRHSLPILLITTGLLAGWKYGQLMVVERRARAGATMSSSAAPNVLLIVMDTVRASSLSLHGYERDTTPNLARLAKRGVRFDHARSTAPWTLPSHASMFTGRWPHQLSAAEDQALDATYPTVAEVLTDRGYATGGFVANTHFCNIWFGLNRGFTHYEDMCDEFLAVSLAETLHCSMLGQCLVRLSGLPLEPDRMRKDAGRINRDFLAWVSEQKGRPFFAFLNYFDAHDPYLLPDEVLHDSALKPRNSEEIAALMKWSKRPKQNVPPQLNDLVRDAYDDCITHIDDRLGQLFDEMDRRGLLEKTLVIITSDHGEQLGEHGLFLHGRSLYREEVHVPLVVVPPGGMARGVGIPDPVSLRDLPATIVDVVGLRSDSPFPGKSLAGYWNSDSASKKPLSDPVLTQVALRENVSNNKGRAPAWRGPMKSLVADGSVYILNADGDEELYDLEADPREIKDLADIAHSAPILERFRNALDDLLGKEPPSR